MLLLHNCKVNSW
ncbi:unnamed protein product [Acanthoscelides obtectus]|uniref:Uncharacterized protein n=1 Tax=Acanthoscelides obtectus TaxID=200917 RepID=A0A9P0LG08_ACAOB|nr:unnamed protein product [Acanthoscelides obtectus]CAK1642527.1 hypothetical protein AOBTE_LOCUS13096 [Acanthoscelides obtectus]